MIRTHFSGYSNGWVVGMLACILAVMVFIKSQRAVPYIFVIVGPRATFEIVKISHRDSKPS